MKKQNFTLIEILAVVAIIGILSVVGFGTYSYAMNFAKESSTKALIKRLEVALDTAKSKHGYYPTRPISATTNNYDSFITFTINNNMIVNIRIEDPNEPSYHQDFSSDYRDDFLKAIDAESLKKMIKRSPSTSTLPYILQDAWGGNIVYRYPGTANQSKYDIISGGADGNINTSNDEDDDINNFEE